jgi:[acyl-carrier-protein] S-malonyltransferase
LGEYTALVAAGALSLHDGAHLVRIRGQLMQDAAPAGVGAMAAVLGADDALVAEVCEAASGSQVVVPANYNSPGQIVIGGDAAAVDARAGAAGRTWRAQGVKLAVSVPSHTPLMREAANRLAETMAGLQWRMPSLPVVQNVDARCTTAWTRSAMRWCASSTCRCSGPAACRRWPRAASAASPNAARARCWPAWPSASTSHRRTRARHAGEFAGCIEEWNA